tara:strand:- start:410 stop:1660 length:1251 start_codon:yes stop_codon:yes gene_type:complete
VSEPIDVVAVFRDLVRLDTSNPPGNEVIAVSYLRDLFDRFGVSYEVVEPEPTRQSIVARIGPETGREPIVLISHLDVVPANPAEWDYPPFDAVEDAGEIYGRGTIDTKYLTAMELGAFLQARTWNLNRPVYFVATADEEQGSTHGMAVVAERYADAFRGGIVINEGGGFFVPHGTERLQLCTAGEKGRCTVRITIDGSAGPASFPSDNRTVATLTDLFRRMASHPFPVEENAVSRRFDEILGDGIEDPFLRAFREYNRRDAFILRQYDVGSQINVLPAGAAFEVQLHLLPGRDRAAAEGILDAVFRDSPARWEITDFRPAFISDIAGEAYRALERAAATHFGATRLLPVFALGQTDGRFLGTRGCHVYGFAPVTDAIPFSGVLERVHQKNESVTRDSVELGARVLGDLIQATAQGE